MKLTFIFLKPARTAVTLCFAFSVLGQNAGVPGRGLGPPPGPPGFDGPPPLGFGPGGPGEPRGPGRGGIGGMMRQDLKLVKQFDKDGNSRLDAAERKAAREFLQREGMPGRGGRGGFRFGGRGGEMEPPQPGPKLSPVDVKSFPDAPLYDAQTLRTFFLEFEEADWEKELVEFHNTDVEVPAKLTVDGKTYQDVGVHFRGMSSFGVGEGRKRSLNLSLDLVHEQQQLGGYRTLNLLNSHEDPTFLRTVLYHHIAREYIPAPRANLVRVVINGESWGIYVNAQQFNKDFIKDWFGTTKGARWKVPGSPGGRGSLAYLGDDLSEYKRVYEIKSKDDPKAWADLLKLCKVLNRTPADKLEAALDPLLDIDGALKFLALENALINNDGYWIRTSDYSIYRDEKKRFHIIPHDANETFARAGGP
ncbi:MAG: CotH kinase family protein, partial [Verrucomicrobia bacterium]|nr:CotH kinase family protein [Verrucomicrobiota bacterium]